MRPGSKVVLIVMLGAAAILTALQPSPVYSNFEGPEWKSIGYRLETVCTGSSVDDQGNTHSEDAQGSWEQDPEPFFLILEMGWPRKQSVQVNKTWRVTEIFEYQAPDGTLIQPTGQNRTLNIQLNLNATTSLKGPSRSGSMSTGQGDPEVTLVDPQDKWTICSSGGRRLYTFFSETGHVELTREITGSANVSDPNGNADALIWATWESGIDSRRTQIVTTLGTTFHEEDGHVQVANIPKPGDPLYVDTLLYRGPFFPSPDALIPITYRGIDFGNWSNNSQYSWQIGSRYTLNGLWNPLNIGDFTVYYPSSRNRDGSSHSVTLRVKDGVDGAESLSESIVRFHKFVKHWTRTGMEPYPQPAEPSYPNNLGGWHAVGPFNNYSDSPDSHTISVSNSRSFSVSGTISSKQGIQWGAAVKGAFEVNEGITIGQNYTSSVTQSYTTPLPARQQTWIFWGLAVDKHYGECCVYGENGFEGRSSWEAYVPQQLPGDTLAIRFTKKSDDLQSP